MHKTLIIAKREYLESVKRKGFIIGLLVAPLLMGGGFLGMLILDSQKDTMDKKVAVIDHTSKLFSVLHEEAENHNVEDVFDNNGERNKSTYYFELIVPDRSQLRELRLDLSRKVK